MAKEIELIDWYKLAEKYVKAVDSLGFNGGGASPGAIEGLTMGICGDPLNGASLAGAVSEVASAIGRHTDYNCSDKLAEKVHYVAQTIEGVAEALNRIAAVLEKQYSA